MILGFRELGNNYLLYLALYKLLLNYFDNFEFPHFKVKCENWERSVKKSDKSLWDVKQIIWEKIKGVWLLSQENRKLRGDLITVLQYTYHKNAYKNKNNM